MKLKSLLLIAPLFLSACNCLNKKDCSAPYLEAGGTYFYNFKLSELDSMWIVTYPVNSGFTNAYDSMRYTRVDIDSVGDQRFTIRYTIHSGSDTKIYLPKANRVFTVNNFRWREVTCKKCAFKKETTQEFDGFDLDGKSQSGLTLNMYK